MSVSSVSDIRLDFVRSKYVAVNAKQFDQGARKVRVSCYNNGEFVKVGDGYNYAYLRMRRIDGKCIFLACSITKDGRIEFTFKKPMLDLHGKSWADIILIAAKKPNINKTIGLFAIGNEENKAEHERVYYPLPIVSSDDDGHVIVTQVDDKGKIYTLNQDPSPFVTDDNNGNVVAASVMESGEIIIEEAGVISTMPFCINVIKSAYFEENTGFIM